MLSTYKGNSVVVMESMDTVIYWDKMGKILSDSAYRSLAKNSTGRIERRKRLLLEPADFSSEVIKCLMSHSSNLHAYMASLKYTRMECFCGPL